MTKNNELVALATKQLAYSRAAAERLAVDLLNTAASALMNGTGMKKPQLPRVSPADDAITAQALRMIAASITDSMQETKQEH